MVGAFHSAFPRARTNACDVTAFAPDVPWRPFSFVFFFFFCEEHARASRAARHSSATRSAWRFAGEILFPSIAPSPSASGASSAVLTGRAVVSRLPHSSSRINTPHSRLIATSLSSIRYGRASPYRLYGERRFPDDGGTAYRAVRHRVCGALFTCVTASAGRSEK